MKKLITILIFTAISIAVIACNSFKKFSKDVESDWGDLNRNVVVTSAFTGDTLFRYSGKCYISQSSTVGDVTLIYYDGGEAKKADFIGNWFNFVAIEK